VTGSSQELYELFADLKKMFRETGYILQQVCSHLASAAFIQLMCHFQSQCALANNGEHFKMVLESVSCSEEDLLYTDDGGESPLQRRCWSKRDEHKEFKLYSIRQIRQICQTGTH
jgi:hypothetical protein